MAQLDYAHWEIILMNKVSNAIDIPKLPLPPTQPIPIPHNETPKQYDDDDICGSFHEHSIKCNPIIVARCLAFSNPKTDEK